MRSTMKFIKIPVPNDGYCAFYAFSLGLLVSIKYNGYKLPQKLSDQLNIEIRSMKRKKVFKEAIVTSDFVKDTFHISNEAFIENYPNFDKHNNLNEMIKDLKSLEHFYALAYIIGTIIGDLNKFKKYESSPLKNMAYLCNVNLNVLMLGSYILHYENNTNKSFTVSISWDDGHFECLIPLMSPLVKSFSERKIQCEIISTEKLPQYEGSYYNYWIKTKNFLSKHQGALLFSGALTLGVVAIKMLSNDEESTNFKHLNF